MSLRPAGPTLPMTRRRGRWERIDVDGQNVWHLVGTVLQIWRAGTVWRVSDGTPHGRPVDRYMNTTMKWVEDHVADLAAFPTT